MELRDSLPCSQKSTIKPCPELVQSSPSHPFFFKIYIPIYSKVSQVVSSPKVFELKFYFHISFHLCLLCFQHILIHLDFITITILGEDCYYKVLDSVIFCSLCYFSLIYFIHPSALCSQLTPWCRIFFEKLVVTQLVKEWPAFILEPKGSLLCSQKPNTRLILSHLNSVHPINPYLPEVCFNVILPPMLRSSQWSLPLGPPNQGKRPLGRYTQAHLICVLLSIIITDAK
jgi:hypothetical protein